MGGVWRTLKIGGGGYMTGIDKSIDETTIVSRTDTYGGYIWNGVTEQWDQLITASSLPAIPTSLRQPETWLGCVELVVAPNRPNRLYMMWAGDVYRSDNRGQNWIKLNLNWGSIFEQAAINVSRFMGQKMAVDPSNSDVVYVGTPDDGVYRSFDAGNRWEQISTGTIPACTITFGSENPGHPGICFDATSGTTSNRTNIIYIPVYGEGVYKSTDAGTSFNLLNGGVTRIRHAKCAHGNYYAAENGVSLGFDGQSSNFTVGEVVTGGTSGATGVVADQTDVGVTGTLFFRNVLGTFVNDETLTGSIAGSATANGSPVDNRRYLGFYNGSSWSDITPSVATDIESVLIDPADPDRVIAVGSGGGLYLSTDAGSSYGGAIPKTRVSPDIPWLEYTTENFMSLGDMIFVGNEIWNAHGIGVAKTPFSGTPSSIEWTYISKGIENLTVNDVVCPPNGNVVLASWDRAIHVITNPETYPAVHYPDNKFRMAWDVDYASSDPSFLAESSMWGEVVGGAFDSRFGWYSTDGGSNWSAFATSPGITGNIPLQDGGSWIKIGGSIACSTPNNIIIVPANNSLPWYTKDGGTTWNEIVIEGVPTSGETGYSWAYYTNFKCVAADRVAANTFYLYNYVTEKVYRSTNSGDTWAEMNSTNISGIGSFGTIKTVPGQEGHLFMVGGPDGNPGDSNPGTKRMLRSTDGGATWTEIAGFTIREPHAIGFGVAAPGQSYPAIAFAGWLDGVYGLWLSIDNCTSWISLGIFPTNRLSRVIAIEGSKEIYGTWYLAMSGSSYAYRTEAMQYGSLL